MKKILLLSVLLAASISHSGYTLAQDTILFRYLPLRVGNVWVYYGQGWFGGLCGYGAWYDKYRLTSTTVINGKLFFTVSHTRIIVSGCVGGGTSRLFYGDLPIRIDSANLNIYKSSNCGTSSELLVDSLRAR